MISQLINGMKYLYRQHTVISHSLLKCDILWNCDPNPLCSLFLLLLQRKEKLLWSTLNPRLPSGSSRKWLPAIPAHAGILPPVRTPSVHNGTEHPAEPRGDNALGTVPGGSLALQSS